MELILTVIGLVLTIFPPLLLWRIAKRLWRKARAARAPKIAPASNPYAAPTPAHLLVGVHAGPIATCVTAASLYQPPSLPYSSRHTDSTETIVQDVLRFERNKTAAFLS